MGCEIQLASSSSNNCEGCKAKSMSMIFSKNLFVGAFGINHDVKFLDRPSQIFRVFGLFKCPQASDHIRCAL